MILSKISKMKKEENLSCHSSTNAINAPLLMTIMIGSEVLGRNGQYVWKENKFLQPITTSKVNMIAQTLIVLVITSFPLNFAFYFLMSISALHTSGVYASRSTSSRAAPPESSREGNGSL